MKLGFETALIEAILLMEPDPVHINLLAKISKFSKKTVIKALSQLNILYSEVDLRGIELLQVEDKWQLIPNQKLWTRLREYYGREKSNRLSKAAIETLSIIAYSQPITRIEIDGIRGVSSVGMIKLLLDKNLIVTVGKKSTPGQPVQYGTSDVFLKFFSLKSISDLPKLDDFEQSRFVFIDRK